MNEFVFYSNQSYVEHGIRERSLHLKFLVHAVIRLQCFRIKNLISVVFFTSLYIPIF